MVTSATRRPPPASIMMGRGADRHRRRVGEVFGVARMLEAGAIEQRLGDRVGDDGRRLARARVFDGEPDRFDDGGRGAVGLAGRGAAGNRQHWQRVGEARQGVAGFGDDLEACRLCGAAAAAITSGGAMT